MYTGQNLHPAMHSTHSDMARYFCMCGFALSEVCEIASCIANPAHPPADQLKIYWYTVYTVTQLLLVHSLCTYDSDAAVFVLQPTGNEAPGVSVNISRSAAPASPAARHLLQDVSDDGVNLTITITAPASQMHNVSDLVSSVVQSSSVRRQLQEAGNTASDDLCLHCMYHMQCIVHALFL